MNRLIKYSLFGSMLLTHIVDAKSIAIVGAKVHTMSSQGTVDNATVFIKDGKIQSIKVYYDAEELRTAVKGL